MTLAAPTLFDSPGTAAVLSQLEHILSSECIGWRKAIPAAELAARLGISQRGLRLKINEAIDLLDLPIGSSILKPIGYFLLRSEHAEDNYRGTTHLERHAIAVFVRLANIRRISMKRLLQELPFGDE